MPRGKRVISITELEKMLNDRKADLAKLQDQRSAMAKKLEELDRQISQMGGNSNGNGGATGSVTSTSRGPGRRAKNSMSLVAALESALQGKEPMKVADIVTAVENSGYRSSSANFRGIVNQTLIKDKRFTSASRGMYQLK